MMNCPPQPPASDDDPYGKPAVAGWLVERVRAQRAAARADAETSLRICRVLDRIKGAAGLRTRPTSGLPTSGDRRARDDADASAQGKRRDGGRERNEAP
jgi:hypothetical protein